MKGCYVLNNKIIGDKGESIAVQYLLKNKYTIIERNFRCRFGEIDIIAKKDNCIIFFEVKTRRSFKYGRPIEAIDSRKIGHILKTIYFYLNKNRLDDIDYRIDAIEVILNNNIKINHIENIIH